MLNPAQNPQSDDAETGEGRAQRAPRPRPDARQVTLDPSWRAGRKLAEARRQLGLSLDEVADRIRVRREFLEALEEMNVKLLPGKAYALAFLRSYARELGIDEKAIVDQFQDESALTREDAQRQIRSPTSRPLPQRPWLAAAALVVIAVGFVGWRALQQNRSEVVPEVSAPVTGNASLTPASIGAATEQRVIEIRALSEGGWRRAGRMEPCSSPGPCSRAMCTVLTRARAGPCTPATAEPSNSTSTAARRACSARPGCRCWAARSTRSSRWPRQSSTIARAVSRAAQDCRQGAGRAIC
ncbi:MAG: helix-turn-helix domain-containing protein [Hyphomonadaceae bacterium]